MTYIDNIQDIKILRISGDFNKYTTPDLQKICYSVTVDPRTRAVVIDFNNVQNVDSASFACMLNFIKEHMSKDIKIGIINIKEKDKDLLEILRLEKVIKIYTSEQDSIEKLKAKY